MVASAEFDPVIVDSRFSLDRLRELLAYARESAKLDYKRDYDVSSTRDTVEIVKDLVAMANTAGGYICIGIEDSGAIVGSDPTALARIDEATVRAKLQSYIGTAIEVFVDSPVELDTQHFGVITVLKSARSPIVFEKPGQYALPNGKNKTVFLAGDVLVRHGSASERWNQDDVATIYARVVEREKERWLTETVPDMKRMVQQLFAGPGAWPQPDPKAQIAQDADAFERLAREIARKFT